MFFLSHCSSLQPIEWTKNSDKKCSDTSSTKLDCDENVRLSISQVEEKIIHKVDTVKKKNID